MRIRCEKKLGTIHLTVGKTYDVISTRGSGSDFEVKADDGTDRFYSCEHFAAAPPFEKVEPLSPAESAGHLGPVPKPLFPHDSKARKAIPMMKGLLNYFPSALAEVAKVSKAGNDKHNPGQPLHHARGKSNDHTDSAIRHLMEFEADNNAIDPDTGCSVLASALWRVAAVLQEHLESRGAPLAPGAKKP